MIPDEVTVDSSAPWQCCSSCSSRIACDFDWQPQLDGSIFHSSGKFLPAASFLHECTNACALTRWWTLQSPRSRRCAWCARPCLRHQYSGSRSGALLEKHTSLRPTVEAARESRSRNYMTKRVELKRTEFIDTYRNCSVAPLSIRSPFLVFGSSTAELWSKPLLKY